MFELDQDTLRHTRAPSRPAHHRHEIDVEEATATLDAAEWMAIGAFLDQLSPDVYASHTASLYAAYRLQSSIRAFVDALVGAGYYSRQ